MSRCHFCGAERPAGDAPCPACREVSVPSRGARWWESNATVLIALAFLGPFALPLVWANPRYKTVTKVTLTVATIAVSVWAVLFTRVLVRRLLEALSAVS